MKIYLYCITSCLLVIAACDNPIALKHKGTTIATKPIKAKSTHIAHDTISIAAVGDIMMGTSYPNNVNLPPDSGKNSFKAVLKELQQADITFGNLEGTLLEGGHPADYKKKMANPYYFRMPPAYAGILKEAGFDIVSLANNHVGDFGEHGRISTTKVLDSIGIRYAGLLTQPTIVFKSGGITYGFCAFAPNANTVPITDLKNAAAIISNLKKQVNIVIVSFHGGGEGLGFEHVPFKMESFMRQKRGDVHAFAHNAIDAGADVIFGNGPHVTRALEVYNKRLIAYSLGNFCTYKSVSVAGVCGIAPLLKVFLNKKGEFLNGRIIPIKQTHLNGLECDSTSKIITRIKMLTETDFPRSGLNIADDGIITVTQQ
ncbi:CapA family protein [Mucilaginibacter sp. HMF5004]|uniref:CapA family protein n=1 Tax=Mucilaginibacter rivuli TaxID=2857527 RepID=UPI001C5F7F8F|nr:CapA family protein [Mucilaginibacter rivuli]MBW4890443.1 CapA family protein [Mucilaginibacter rivuli]